ncbi:FtsX-like permease family protein [Arachidicoccus rhizosphaerae]|uniref:FtsX-like permease family protein n=1 Tax=Arachidicoccus rhizosphaerae TaxID=551991 RepID=A0A1H4CD61_9BACT|nr:ABC transporter permease [Arachidicoccus rhizosphaerae]SEA58260.1 FtsX-like permease family protein [Arachidicoccus rhizosphaerae]
MENNNLKTAFRSLKKDRTFSLLNLAGLSLALFCSLMILLWIREQKSIDNFHNNGKDIYIIYENLHVEGDINSSYRTQGILAAPLKEKIPEIKEASNVAWLKDEPDRAIFKVNARQYQFETIFADSNYLKILSYPLLAGDPNKTLNSPKSICISESMAKALFSDPNKAIGQIISYDGKKDLKITAVFKNQPPEASQRFDCIINWPTFLEENTWAKDWGNVGTNTLVMLKKSADPKLTAKKIKHFVDTYVKPDNHYRITLGLQRYGDSYLHDKFENGQISGGKIQYVRLFRLIALFIMIIASINFVNLSTARAVTRAKSTAVRKIIGASRRSLIWNYLTEAFIVTLLATLIALFAVAAALPGFNQLTHSHSYIPGKDPIFWAKLILLVLLTSLAAGLYPAIMTTSFKPIVFLQKTLSVNKNSLIFRKGLVVFQFVLANLLIAGTVIIFQQIHYIHHLDLGFDRNNLIELPVTSNIASKYEAFKNKALQINGVQSLSKMGENPTSVGSLTFGVSWPGKNPNDKIMFNNAAIGYDFVKTLKLHLKAGRDFSKAYPSDTVGYLINEAAQKVMGLDQAVGQPLNFWGHQGSIIGVLKNFHFSSLHDPINPIIFYYGENKDWGNILIRVEPSKTKVVLTSLEKLYKNITGGAEFTYTFSDDDFNKMYQKEQLLSKLSGYFSFIAIFISCLGLLGLIIFAANQRTKEIGIRKILGARVGSILKILLKEFAQLIFISIVIATPLCFYLMQKWLGGYAYRIQIHWWVFLIAGCVSVIIAFFTVGYQTLKAAVANPVDSLRSE